MRRQIPLLLGALLVCSVPKLFAADYYWIGGSGNWSDINHWATSSGGSTVHAAVPGPSDNVYFDANSFTAANQSVNLNTTISFKDMDWTGTTNSPTISGLQDLNIYGSLTLIASMDFGPDDDINFLGTGTHDVNFAGQTTNRPIYFNGTGTFNLQDSLVASNTLYLRQGTLNTNNHKVVCRAFNSGGSANFTLNLGESVLEVTLNASGNSFYQQNSNFSCNGDSATLYLSGNTCNAVSNVPINFSTIKVYRASTINFVDGSVIDTIYNEIDGYINLSQAYIIQSIDLYGNLNIYDKDTIGRLDIDGDLTVYSGQNIVVDSLILRNSDGSNTHRFNQTGSFIVNDSIWIEEATCLYPTTIKSYSTSSQANISLPSGTVSFNYVILEDMNFTGGASFTANNVISEDGNNSGITINTKASQDLYWVGGTGNWTDPTHWATSSGGVGQSVDGCYPREGDNVYFDVNSFSAASQTVTLDANAYCKDMDWTGATNTPTFASSGRTLYIYGSLNAISAMNWNHNYVTEFMGTGTHTIDMDGVVTDMDIRFRHTGTYSLSDSLRNNDYIKFYSGTFNSNNHRIRCYIMASYNSIEMHLNFGTSEVELYNSSSINSNSYAMAFFNSNGNTTYDLDQTDFLLTGGNNYVQFRIDQAVDIAHVTIDPKNATINCADNSSIDTVLVTDSTGTLSLYQSVNYGLVHAMGSLT
ncbi:MAG: hypothetical protein HKP14_05075, partial [Bacteroidia bacterium]|nr:hypothetical protein [Bacteroidia bacterium]